jgi:transcriptional regulator with XRE-family HTH domain
MGLRKEPTTSNFSIKTSNFFKEKRIALGLSQTDVAEIIYGERRYRGEISNLESGKKQMTIYLIDKFCEAFKCTVDFTEKII